MVSYAWGTDEQDLRVKTLVDQLIGDGIEVTYDRYDLHDGADVNAFMEQVAARGNIRKVIALCTPKYVQRMNDRQGGSGQEGMIMSPGVYQQLRDSVNPEAGEQSRRFIPVIFERNPELPEDGHYHVPTMFGSMKYIDMTTPASYDVNYDQLLRFLLDKPEWIRPPLGQVPAHLREEAPPTLPSHPQFLTLKRRLEQDKATTATWRDYFSQVEAALLDLQPAIQGTVGHSTFDFSVGFEETERFTPVRDEFIQAIQLGLQHDQLPMSEVMRFFEQLANLNSTLQEQHRDGNIVLKPVVFGHADLLVVELVLYTTALLIQKEKIDDLKELTETTLFYKTRTGEVPESFALLGRVHEQRAWEDGYSQHAGHRWRSPLAGWLQQRANQQSVPVRDLVNADRLLAIKSVLQRQPGQLMALVWRPTLGTLMEQFPEAQPFRRFVSRRVLNLWLPFFAVDSGANLTELLHQKFPSDSFGKFFGDDWFMISLETFLKVEEWGQLN